MMHFSVLRKSKHQLHACSRQPAELMKESLACCFCVPALNACLLAVMQMHIVFEASEMHGLELNIMILEILSVASCC